MTISTDTPEEIRQKRHKHGLSATMLSDRELRATDLFGLRNRGVHSGPPPPIAPTSLPIPTSLLVDEEGRVLWMDQSEDYQRRSDPDIVRGALRHHIDHRPASTNTPRP